MHLLSGHHHVGAAPLTLGPDDSGSHGACVTWRGEPGSVLSGGVEIPVSAWSPVPGSPQHPPVWQVNLTALGLPEQALGVVGQGSVLDGRGDASAFAELSTPARLRRWHAGQIRLRTALQYTCTRWVASAVGRRSEGAARVVWPPPPARSAAVAAWPDSAPVAAPASSGALHASLMSARHRQRRTTGRRSRRSAPRCCTASGRTSGAMFTSRSQQ